MDTGFSILQKELRNFGGHLGFLFLLWSSHYCHLRLSFVFCTAERNAL